MEHLARDLSRHCSVSREAYVLRMVYQLRGFIVSLHQRLAPPRLILHHAACQSLRVCRHCSQVDSWLNRLLLCFQATHNGIRDWLI